MTNHAPATITFTTNTMAAAEIVEALAAVADGAALTEDQQGLLDAVRREFAGLVAEVAAPVAVAAPSFREQHDSWVSQRGGFRGRPEFPTIPAGNKVKVQDPTANEYVDNGDVLYAIQNVSTGQVRIANSSGLCFTVGDLGEFTSQGRRLGYSRVIGAKDVATGEVVGTFPAKGTFPLWIVK